MPSPNHFKGDSDVSIRPSTLTASLAASPSGCRESCSGRADYVPWICNERRVRGYLWVSDGPDEFHRRSGGLLFVHGGVAVLVLRYEGAKDVCGQFAVSVAHRRRGGGGTGFANHELDGSTLYAFGGYVPGIIQLSTAPETSFPALAQWCFSLTRRAHSEGEEGQSTHHLGTTPCLIAGRVGSYLPSWYPSHRCHDRRPRLSA